MQTILGANGQIAVELARELNREYTTELRLVSRNPRKVDDADTLASADLLDAGQTAAAVEGSDIVYFTAGLPADTALWEKQFPTMLKNALDATRAAGAKFAYFDNTYMYSQDARVQTEDTPFAPVGRKGRVRAEMASMVLEEIERGEIPGSGVLRPGSDPEHHEHPDHRQPRGRQEASRAGARRPAADAHLDPRRESRAGGTREHTGRIRADLASAVLR